MAEKKLTKMEYIKKRTLELYNSLPQDEEGRKCRLDVRDEVIDLNYAFFGYVATHTYVNNPYITYEDKLQSALLHFCECWWWYMWAERYRTDLSFTVFFKPRLSEMIDRELTEVKYSIRRSLCMEAGDQLGKHWAKVRYDDLSDPRLNLPTEKMNSLKAIFGSLYMADLSDHEMFLESPVKHNSIENHVTDNYDSIEELLITEMIETEEKLTPRRLKKMSDVYQIDIDILKDRLPVAEKMLYERIKENMDISDIE